MATDLSPVRRIGLTGGIGSGKSSVARTLVALGAVLVDTDAIAHGLTTPGGAAMPHLVDAFGADIADAQGALDRQRMRELAFADPAARQRLEAILHPMIGEQAVAQALGAGDRVVVFDVPLMHAASPWRARCQRILVIDCDEGTQVARVVARSGWDEAQVRTVIASQLPRAARRAIADAVIVNHQGLSLARLETEVTALWSHWTVPRDAL